MPKARVGREDRVRLAKLSPPRLAQAADRERLYERLDELLEAPVAWVCGPPGAGKTTLAAGYAKSRGRYLLWYQIDRGDDDIASFFRYFEQALPAGRRGAPPLPTFSPELLTDVQGFTRDFARAALERLREGTVIVLDNVHEAGSPPFRQMLATWLSEIPAHIRVLAASRAVPPRELAGLLANRRIAILQAEDLQFSPEEAAELLVKRRLPSDVVDRLQRETGGWAAGLILMSERARGAEAHAQIPRTHEALFAYFATQVIEHLPGDWQRFLLLTSILPKVTPAMGDALAGTRDGEAILEGLHRQHLFVDRREERGATYQYHALFRGFLAERAAATLPPAMLESARREAARLAERESWTSEAIELHLEAQAWDEAARIIGEVAQPLLSRGLAHTIEGWILRFPEPAVEKHPALFYFLGQSLIQRDELAARAAYERAHAGFVRQGDEGRALLAAGAVLDAIFTSFRDWTGVNAWIAAVRRHSSRSPLPAAPLDQLRAHACAYLALAISADRDAEAAGEILKVLLPLLVDDAIDANERLRVATLVVSTSSRFTGQESLLRSVIAIAERLIRNPVISSFLVARFLLCAGEEASSFVEHEAALGALDRARALCERHGWSHMRFELAYRATRIAFQMGDLPACEAACAEVDRLAQAGVLPQALYRAYGHYCVARLKGDKAQAVESARELVDVARRVDLPRADLSHSIAVLGFAYIADGRFHDAVAAWDEVASMIVGFERDKVLAWRELTLAAAWPEGVPNPHLAEGMSIAASNGIRNLLNHVPEVAARLLSAAWRQGIERDYVAGEIALRGIVPDEPEDGDWPWPVKVRTLGAFSIESGGRPLASSGKTARRPIDLLKFAAASGRREVAAAQAIGALWPDLEGDQAKSAFNVALHRLRKLLGRDDAITLEAGRIGLSDRLVWVDSLAFESDAAKAEALFAKGDFAEGERRAERALSLYRGPFLGDEEDGGWQIVARTRIGSKFHRLVALAAKRWTLVGETDRARSAYERALELDPVAEEIYRQLMLLHIGLGQPAEAIRVYRRCRQMLSVVLGVKPSPETERVHEALRGS